MPQRAQWEKEGGKEGRLSNRKDNKEYTVNSNNNHIAVGVKGIL